MINKDSSFKSYKEICLGEKKKVNLGYWGNWMVEGGGFKVENNTLVHMARTLKNYIYGQYSSMSYDWEILSKFFSIHNIEPNWLDCDYITGYYDEDLGEYTGCYGKVWESDYLMW